MAMANWRPYRIEDLPYPQAACIVTLLNADGSRSVCLATYTGGARQGFAPTGFEVVERFGSRVIFWDYAPEPCEDASEVGG